MNGRSAGGVPAPAGGPRVKAVLLLRVAVSAGLLALIFWWLPVDQIIAGVSSVPLWVWVACLTGFATGHIVAALKWRVLLTGVGVTTDRGLVLRAHGAGLFANLCLPSIVGGDFIRAALVVKNKGKVERVAIASLADRLIDTLVLVIIAIVAIALLPDRYVQAATESFRYVPMIVTVCLIFLIGVVALTLLISVIPAHYYPQKLRGIVTKIRTASGALYSAPSVALIALLLSFSIQCGFILLNVLLAYGVGISLPVLIWFAAWPLAKLIALVPVSIGGIGVRDAALMSLLVPFGVGSSAAIAQSLSWQAVLWATGLIAGALIVILAYYSKSKTPVRQILQGELD